MAQASNWLIGIGLVLQFIAVIMIIVALVANSKYKENMNADDTKKKKDYIRNILLAGLFLTLAGWVMIIIGYYGYSTEGQIAYSEGKQYAGEAKQYIQRKIETAPSYTPMSTSANPTSAGLSYNDMSIEPYRVGDKMFPASAVVGRGRRRLADY